MSTGTDPVLQVQVDVQTEGGQAVVVCTPELLSVTGHNSLLTFRLTNPDYRFPQVGAIVVQNPGTEFPNCWQLDEANMALRDRCNNAASYNYTVTVEHKTSGARRSVDPIIQNGDE